MKTLKIVTDSSADMPNGWAQKYGINILPINIHFGDKTYRQGIDLSNDQFYELVEQTQKIPKTSLPTPGQIIEFYEKIAKAGDQILSIHVSSKMSGTLAMVEQAAHEVAGRFKVTPFDSGGGSAMLAYLCMEARILDKAGATIQDIVDRLAYIRRMITIIFTVDTLDFARLSGRVNRLQTSLSSLLKIKPIIALKENGSLDITEKVRTRGRSIDRLLEMVKQRVGDRKVNIAVVHARDLQTARDIKNRVSKLLNVKDLITTELSISVAAHLGPRTVGLVAYPVDEG
ncbi:MAG: DegV family protein [Anaerolineaceae bacterium]|nr:DegV family protein [Anaerolineaceae bacterium]MBN2676500.1 DegV family protein [Anaerolineaceae bacterium]